MSNQRWHCIDAGSEYCPCYLAETMDCITCSHLKNKRFCDCDWRGVCIYQAYVFEGNKKNPRLEQEVEVVEVKKHGENIIEFAFQIPHALARLLNQPGAYIFIRNKKLNQYFDIPISIMHVDPIKDIATIIVEIHGVKTKKIKEVTDQLIIRGPYWNGILGLEHLKQIENVNCLAIIRGIAQAPSILVIKHLLKHNNSVDLIIDTNTIKHNFITEYCNINTIKTTNLYEAEGLNLIDKQLKSKKYDLIFLGASDYLQNRILNFFPDIKNKRILTTNNHEICCGEGICGSCTIHDINGVPIRTCKTQITPCNN